MVKKLQRKIEKFFDCQAGEFDSDEAIGCIDEVFELLNTGEIRVTEKIGGTWIVNTWIKKAILLAFKLKRSRKLEFDSYDKIGLLKFDYDNPRYRKVPNSVIRDGVYIGNEAVVMPSYINVGAYIGDNTMIDINATIGSCAYVGKNCHISANSCIGGVLEPAVATPVIIEDNCFIGVHSSILEGVIVEANSVIAAGVNITASTKIIDRETGERFQGIVPEGSVVVPGCYQSNDLGIACGVIIKKSDHLTRSKSNINIQLRS
ncbi:MAG: 2,3,4,5-tetrahydropyridine-2,6-dicarboxylate N-succinyltransferase [Holosporales bacterium]|jgi:2,3,4,5-tetrahydropyridine-2-carboxylate N-succinyltransferase|nr:2,3,4,5-tetrahydropyridine-2,6-dicarboxylate N-succinyltransferase [Holosporales bacterium]